MAALPIGGDIRLNRVVEHDQEDLSIAPLPGGGFVAAWESDGQDGSARGVFASIHDVCGDPQGDPFQVNITSEGAQADPAVAAFSDGSFVIAWQSEGQDGDGHGIVARRFDADGTPASDEILVNTTTAGGQSDPSVAALADGSFVVVWESEAQDGDGFGVYGQRFVGDGSPAGGEFQVNTSTNNSQSDPVVTALVGGGFVVAWESFHENAGDVVFQSYGVDGNPVGGETRANTFTANAQSDPALAALADGGFVIAWKSALQDGAGMGVFAQRFDADGNPVGGEFQANTTTAGNQQDPTIAALPDGGFVIGWESFEDSATADVMGQIFDAEGNPVGGEFVLSAATDDQQVDPVLAGLETGGFVAGFEGDVPGNADDVFARLFASPGAIAGTDGDDTLEGSRRGDVLAGGAGDDTLSGGNGDDQLYGGDGDDTLSGGNGKDHLDGGAGDDTLSGENGVDRLCGGDGDDTLSGGNGKDHLAGGTGDDTLSGGNGDDRLHGGDGNDTLIGGRGADHIEGGAGDDVMDGSEGSDTLIGGAGDDVYLVNGASPAQIVEARSEAVGGSDTIIAARSFSLEDAPNVEDLILSGSGDHTGVGNRLSNELDGNAGDNLLQGLGGKDKLRGQDGDDTLEGGDGDDTLIGGSGADDLSGGAGGDRFDFNDIAESSVGDPDLISDFSGAEGDMIDVRTIDANSSLNGNQKFAFIGDAAFSGAAGELRAGEGMVEGDIDGDGIADFAIEVTSDSPLVADNFWL